MPGSSATVRFNELMSAGSITSSSFQLKDATNADVTATVTYDATTSMATVTPQSALQYGAVYTVTVKGGAGGVTDLTGNPLAADSTWSFSVEASPPPILVVGSTGNPFGSYLGEILRSEGLNAFTTIDVAFVSPALLAQFDVVVLGNTALSAAQVTTLTGWVNGGGNLIAMRPDKQLAGLLGVTDTGTILSNAYLQVATGSEPGAGIVGSTIQFHGTADRYSLNGATSVATLYSTASTATSNPAVTLRSVGSSGGQAAAFTFDLARSVVYTRQGNPAWASQERDGVNGIRPDDLFYGARAGDVQPDWVDTNKIAIPQADEQQRLLLNLITVMERDKLPLPRFWYLPRGEKAVVVMSGDDHSPTQAPGGTASHFDRYKSLSPAGCSVLEWECIRASSYIYPNATLTNAQAATYQADGFEIGVHPLVSQCPTAAISAEELELDLRDSDLPVSGQVHERRPTGVKPHPLCLLARLDDERDGRARPRDSHGRELLPLPRPVDRRQAGLHERRRLPDALRRPRRHADRRLPGEHERDGRVGAEHRDHDRGPARQRSGRRRATTELSARTCTPIQPHHTRAQKRSSQLLSREASP